MNTPSQKTCNPLNAFRRKGASQYGEEGVIEEVLRIIHQKDPEREAHWCVEFGAGRENTNTRFLIQEKGWHGVLIEAHPVYSKELKNLYAENNRVFCLRSFVGFEGPARLDALLSRFPVPRDFDFLSIDIDGNDYHVWDAVEAYAPQVVMVEYNGRIPHNIMFIQPRDMNISWGSSLSSLIALGRRKGYELIYAHVCNAIFVKKELFPFFNIDDNAPDKIAEVSFPHKIFFELYDGSIVLHGCEKENLLTYKKKFKKHPVWFLDEKGLSPVIFTRDKQFFRIIKNGIKASLLARALYPLAEHFYGAMWKKKREMLRRESGFKKKRIGVVLHPYGEDKPAGLARTIFELTKGMLEIDKENEYVIFLKNTPPACIKLPGENWRVETLGGGRWWLENLRRATRADVYIFNTPMMPLFWKPPRSVVLALDFAYWYLAPKTLVGQLSKWVTFFLHARALKRADSVIAISEATKKDLLSLFHLREEKIKIIYCGFKRIGIVSEKIVPLPEKFFFFAGIIKPRKNVLNTVKAFHLFSTENPEFSLVIGGNGSGEYYESIREYVQRNHLEKKIFFLGHLNDNELSYVYKRAHAFVFPTLIEGFGYPVLEAMDCGIPVITSNLSSLKEIGGNGSALLVNPYCPDDIARAMTHIAKDKEAWQEFVRRGYEQTRLFSWNKAARKLLEVVGYGGK